MKIAFGTDEETGLTDAVLRELENLGHRVEKVGSGEEWPEVGRAVAEAVAKSRADRGVVCCWTGTGVSIAANKVRGARAALCTDAYSAAGARRWNDANVLAMGLRLTSVEIAKEMIRAFLGTDPDEEERAAISRVEHASR